MLGFVTINPVINKLVGKHGHPGLPVAKVVAPDLDFEKDYVNLMI